MSEDRMHYEQLVQDALRGVLRAVLERAGGPDGLPPPHYLYVTFRTAQDGVKIPERLLTQYPEEMTIVLKQHFWDLTVTPEAFDVTLLFQGEPTRLRIPFESVTQLVDPTVPFGLRFDAEPEESPSEQVASEQAAPPAGSGGDGPADGEDAEAEKVVSLDAFRKKS